MKNKKVLIVVLAVIVLGGGAAAFFMLRGGGGDAAHGAAEPAAEEHVPAGIVDMETFLVNLDSPSGADRFAKLSVRLTVVPAERAEELGHDPVAQARMRDRVLTLLSSKSAEELAGPTGKEGLRREIKASLGALVEDGKIEEVLFSDFVVQ